MGNIELSNLENLSLIKQNAVHLNNNIHLNAYRIASMGDTNKNNEVLILSNRF